MSAVTASSQFIEPRTPDSIAPLHGTLVRVKAWGRRGTIFGAGFGFVFGAIFVAIPYTTSVLTLGGIGTLMVGMVECAVIAGAFAALAAALYGKGVPGGNTEHFELILQNGRRAPVSFIRDVPLADWPGRWTYPAHAARLALPQIPEFDPSETYSLADAQDRLGTIDAWEKGNTGP